MTDRAQFEAMLEALINEDQESAKEIFHNIVVSKSREIYEELLAEDFTSEDENATSGQAGEEPMGEMFGDDAEDDSEEPADDAEDDSEEGDDEEGEENPFGDEEGSDSDMDDAEQTDRILDLEDALEELKAEFEQLMGGDDDMGSDDMGGMDAMGDEEELEGQLFEYVNKVSVPKGGDNGVNTKSLIDNMKNDMGGTNKNIAQSFSTEKGGTQGGLLKPTTSVEDFGNVNKPGANAGKTAFKKKEPGHGAEKAGSRETADNKQSLLRQAKK
jgi:hypothetical protein